MEKLKLQDIVILLTLTGMVVLWFIIPNYFYLSSFVLIPLVVRRYSSSLFGLDVAMLIAMIVFLSVVVLSGSYGTNIDPKGIYLLGFFPGYFIMRVSLPEVEK